MVSPPCAARTRPGSRSAVVARSAASISFTSASQGDPPPVSDDPTSLKKRARGGCDRLRALLCQQVAGRRYDLGAQVVAVRPGPTHRPGRDEEVTLAVEHEGRTPQPPGTVPPPERREHPGQGEPSHGPPTRPRAAAL